MLMILLKPTSKTLNTLLSNSQIPIFSITIHKPNKYPLHNHTQFHNYVNTYMKWKKDPFYGSIDHIHKSSLLKSIISIKNLITQNPNSSIPISDISKKGLQFDLKKIKVANFLRKYPSIFDEFTGPEYNLPWFRLTREAVEIDEEEKRVFVEFRDELNERLMRFIMMSREKVVPLKILKGMLWYLGLNDDFLETIDDECFKIVDLEDGLEDGLEGLTVVNSEKMSFLSVLERNAMSKSTSYSSNGISAGQHSDQVVSSMSHTRDALSEGLCEFPLFPSKGVRLKRKIQDWLKEFQKIPYISPYDDYSNLDCDSDLAEKRVVAFLHEMLCLFVEHSAERKKILCLKKYFGLPQKVHKAFERHPYMFYLSFRNKTCTVILKEAYKDELAIERHPILSVRQKYVELIKESEVILKRRRWGHTTNFECLKSPKLDLDLDLDCIDDGEQGQCL
ncbi:protein WHAT'S THIS FACTOR 9, mitochondrial [Mercurialis annua]|uniref:protein WHAT'S THIS FACTOR 9, mitochondrial n=1 Tax=Mercurialis annua TaxID=3986 RepID=UPI0021602935|nr:protein WHAT'S THIS FACTOR 9, mitochondrial [Mercurialis annua]